MKRFWILWTSLIALLIVATLAVIPTHRFFVARISGGSMAESFLGEHLVAQCADCRFSFRCGGDELLNNTQLLICPNCGYRENEPPASEQDVVATTALGEKVIVDRAAFRGRAPQRWDVVALKNPDDATQLVVKRIVGLPNETVAIRHGDVFIDGQLVRRPPFISSQQRIVVHDDSFRPQRSLDMPARWRPATTSETLSGWRAQAIGHRFEPRENSAHETNLESGHFDWLAYHHWRTFATPFPRSADAPLLDNDPYNSAESRALNLISDFSISGQFTLGPNSILAIQLKSRHDLFRAEWKHSSQWLSLFHNAKPIGELPFTPDNGPDGEVIELQVCDQQVVCWLNGKELVRQNYEPAANERNDTSLPQLAIGARGGTITARNLKIFRDIFYLHANGTNETWARGTPLGPREFFLLGDNPAISTDSRHWSKNAVSQESFIGRVIPLGSGERSSAADQNVAR